MNGYPHFEWSFGGKKFSNPVDVKSMSLQFQFLSQNIRAQDFRAECLRACARINTLRKGKTVALCYSGGIRSELIAYCMRELGIPFQPYFLNIWNVNGHVFQEMRPKFESEFATKVIVVDLDRLAFYDDWSKKIFREFAMAAPTYLALSFLFDQIPKDQFIVTGDGDLQSEGKASLQLGKKLLIAESEKNRFIPIKYSGFFYYLWAARYRPEGEYYFFRSTPEIIASQIQDSNFSCNYPFSETSSIIHQHFPEIQPRRKSNNWSLVSYKENVWIREWLAQYALELGYFYFNELVGIPTNIKSWLDLPEKTVQE